MNLGTTQRARIVKWIMNVDSLCSVRSFPWVPWKDRYSEYCTYDRCNNRLQVSTRSQKRILNKRFKDHSPPGNWPICSREYTIFVYAREGARAALSPEWASRDVLGTPLSCREDCRAQTSSSVILLKKDWKDLIYYVLQVPAFFLALHSLHCSSELGSFVWEL